MKLPSMWRWYLTGLLLLAVAVIGIWQLTGGVRMSADEHANSASATESNNALEQMAATQCGTWELLQPSYLASNDRFGAAMGVATISDQDVWVVGYSYSQYENEDKANWEPHNYKPLFLHWDGSKLEEATSETLPKLEEAPGGKLPFPVAYLQLRSVAAVSADDVWAVGFYRTADPESHEEAAIFHWDGKIWRLVPGADHPNPVYKGIGATNALYAVTAVSKDDVWAVGMYNGALIEHWDGSEWRDVHVAGLSQLGDRLEGVCAISANDVWAVGRHDSILHWDGRVWDKVSKTGLDHLSDYFSVEGVAENSVWAVGERTNYGTLTRLWDQYGSETSLWDGSTWRTVESPNPAPVEQGNLLTAVAGVTEDDVWAVGFKNAVSAIVFHWDGSSWKDVDAPQPLHSQTLYDVAATAKGHIWAVGMASENGDIWEGTTVPLVSRLVECGASGAK